MKRESGRVLSRCLLLALLVGAGLVLLNATPGVAEGDHGIDPGWRDFPEGDLAGVPMGIELWPTSTWLERMVLGENLIFKYSAHGIPRDCDVFFKVEIWHWQPGAQIPPKPPAVGTLVANYDWKPVTSAHLAGHSGTPHHVPPGTASGTLVEIRFVLTCRVHRNTKTRSAYYWVP